MKESQKAENNTLFSPCISFKNWFSEAKIVAKLLEQKQIIVLCCKPLNLFKTTDATFEIRF